MLSHCLQSKDPWWDDRISKLESHSGKKRNKHQQHQTQFIFLSVTTPQNCTYNVVSLVVYEIKL